MAQNVILTSTDGVTPLVLSSFAALNGAALNVKLEAAQQFWDDFGTGTLDVTNKWTAPTTGGGGNATAATSQVGFTVLGTGTLANGFSILQSQMTFAGRNPGYVTFQENNNLEYPVILNAYRFWGFATIPGTPTAALPLTNAVGFEIGINGKMSAVTFASGSRNLIADLSVAQAGSIPQPNDNSSHNYRIEFRGDNIVWLLDQKVVAQTLSGALGPDVNTLPVAHLCVANTIAPGTTGTLQINGVTVGDSSRNTQAIRDGTFPWRAATVDATGAIGVGSGFKNAYNVAASAVIKATPGRLGKVSVITAGSAPGTVNDCTTTGAAAIGNQVGVIPNTIGIYAFDWPCTAGITYILGTGQVVAVSYA